eukprot:403333415
MIQCTLVFRNTGARFLTNIVGFNPDYISEITYEYSLSIWIKTTTQPLATTDFVMWGNILTLSIYQPNNLITFKNMLGLNYNSATMPTVQIPNGKIVKFRLKSHTHHGQFLIQKCGNVVIQAAQMVRYYKLLHYGDGQIVFDFSRYEQHHKFYSGDLNQAIWQSDPDMEKEIAFASSKYYSDPDFFKLAIDDFTTSFRQIKSPLYPKELTNLNIEFWYKFVPPSDITPYNFVFVHDPINQYNLKIETSVGTTTYICFFIMNDQFCQQFNTLPLVNTGKWSYYSFQYLSKVSSAYQVLDGYMSTTVGITNSNSKFSFYGDNINFASILSSPPPVGTITCLMKEFRIWNNVRSLYDTKQQIRIKALGAHWSALIGYWPLTQESFGNKYLVDYSMNSQRIQLNSDLKFRGNFDDELVLCESSKIYDSARNICIDPEINTEIGVSLYQNGQWAIKLDTQGQVNIAVEFWFISVDKNFTIYRREDSYVSVKGYEYPVPLSTALVLENTQILSQAFSQYPYAFYKWTHLLVDSKDLGSGNIQINACVCRVCYDPITINSATVNDNALIGEQFSGSIKEVRVWNTYIKNVNKFFYKRQILYPQEDDTLLDYFRMEAYDQSNVYTHWNNPTTVFYLTNFHQSPNIPTSIYPKLNECKFGSYFSGSSCQYDDLVLESGQTQKTSPPQYVVLRHNGCQFNIGQSLTYAENKWYQIVITKSEVGANRFHKVIVTSNSNAIQQNLQQTNIQCPSYQFANGTGDGTIMLGSTINMQKGVSFRNFFFMYPKTLTENEILLNTRVQWKMMRFDPKLFIPLNETQNSWIYDLANPFFITNHRSTQGFYRVHDSYLPVFCNSIYESFNQETGLCEERQVASFAQNEKIQITSTKLNSVWDPNYQMCFGFFLKLQFEGNETLGNIMTFNPTGSASDKVIISYRSWYYGTWGQITLRFLLEGTQKDYDSNIRMSNWGHVAIIRDAKYTVFDFGSSDIAASSTPPLTSTFNFDGKIEIGNAIPPNYIGMKGVMREFMILNKQCQQNDINYMMTKEISYFSQLAHYFTFEEISYFGRIYDYAPLLTAMEFQQQNVNQLKFSSYEQVDEFSWKVPGSLTIGYAANNYYTGLSLTHSVNWCLHFSFIGLEDWSLNDKILITFSNWMEIKRLSTGHIQFYFAQDISFTKSVVTPSLATDRWHSFGVSRTVVGSSSDMHMYIDDVQYFVPNGRDMPSLTASINSPSTGIYVREIFLAQTRCTSSYIRKNQRIWQKGIYLDNIFQPISYAADLKYEICLQDQYYDGVTCRYFYYMYFRDDLVNNFALPISQPITSVSSTGCANYQLEFWTLFWGVDPGDLIRIVMDGPYIQLSQPTSGVNFQMKYYIDSTFERTVTTNFGRNSIIDDTERFWRKTHLKVQCPSKVISLGVDGDWKFVDDIDIEYPQLNFASTSQLIICPGTCQISIAHVVLYKTNIGLSDKPFERIFKKPLPTNVYLYYELVSNKKDEMSVYDLSSTNTPKRFISLNIGRQKFKWWSIKEFHNQAEDLVLCSQDEEFSLIQARCQPAIVQNIKFLAYYGSNATRIKNTNPQISYNNDWTIDLWVNFKFSSDQANSGLSLIQSDCLANPYQISYNLMVQREFSTLKYKISFFLQDYGGTGGLLTENRDIYEGKWIHVAVVNRFQYSDKKIKLYAQAQNPQAQNIGNARSKFPECDIVIGLTGSSSPAPKHYFSLKDLRIWNIAHNLPTLKKIAYEKSYIVGELNLVRYYRFNAFGLQDMINGQGISDYIIGANIISGVFDNSFNMECPYGFMFNNITGSCFYVRKNLALMVNTRVSWQAYQNIAPVVEDHDFSFTLLLQTISTSGGGLDFFFIEDILNILEFNKTHQLSFLREGLTPISRTYVAPLTKTTINWAFMYDGETSVFSIYVENDEIASVYMSYDEMPKTSSWVLDFGALNSYRNTSMTITKHSFFQGIISKNIIAKTVLLSWDPIESTPALKSMLMFEQQIFEKVTDFFNPYDYANRDIEQSFLTDAVLKPVWASQLQICKPGTILSESNCVQLQSLVIYNRSQSFSTTGIKIGYSATVQFWFNIVQEGNPTVKFHFFDLQNAVSIKKIGSLFEINLANFQTGNYQNYPLNTGIVTQNTWYQHTFVIFGRRVCYYQYENLINNITDSNYAWDIGSIGVIYVEALGEHKIKYKEISIMGYPKSQAEIMRDRFQSIDFYMYYQSLIVYYPLNESILDKVYDLSRFARTTTLGTTGVYWDFEPRSPFASNINSDNENNFQTRDKALFFQYGLTSTVLLPQTALKISNIDYTLMFCFNIQTVNDLPSSTTVNVINIEYLANINFYKINNAQVNINFEYYPGVIPQLSLLQVTQNQWSCLIATMFGQDNYTYFMNPDNLAVNYDSLTVNTQTFSNTTSDYRLININPFNVYLREIKLFNVGLSAGNAIRLYRQSINSQLYWGNYLAAYYRMDEGFGLKILNYKTAQYFTILDDYTLNIVAPMWSDPGSKLIICEAESRYSQSGYCQSREKFLQFPQVNNKIAELNLQNFQNITVAVWLYIKQMDNTTHGVTLRHDYKYQIEIKPNKVIQYTLGNYPTQSLDTKNVLKVKRWFIVFAMINKDEDFSQCSLIYFTGQFDIFDFKTKTISKPWSYSSLLNNDQFYIDVSVGTKLFARDLQIWNAPLSLDSFVNFRMKRGQDPIAMKQRMLILYFRFDESAGQNYLSNSAQQYRINKVWNYIYPAQGENKWYYYSNLEADPTYDTETSRFRLFCREPYSRRSYKNCDYYKECHFAVQDGFCTGAGYDSFYKCNQTGNQVFSDTYRDCYDCHPSCATCNVANSKDSCTSCYPDQFLYNGTCSTECPENLQKVNGTCVACDNALCRCLQNDLSVCVACLNSSHYYLQDQLTCIDTLPIEYFYDQDQQNLQKCHPFCQTCDWFDQYSCLSCQNNTYDMGNNFCNAFSCMDGTELLEAGIPPQCTQCQSPCLTCKDLPTKCTSCDDNTVLDDEGQCLPCSAIVGYDYPIRGSGPSKTCTEICGDGLNFGQYQCDDENKNEGDGCNSQCQIEPQMACSGGSPTSQDTCHDIVGPQVEIVAISEQSKLISLQFKDSNGQVYTQAKRLNETDLLLIITGINGEKKYNVKATISDEFQNTGKMSVDFSPYFSIPADDAFIQIKFKHPNQFVDQYNNQLQNVITNKIQLKEYEYSDSATLGNIKAVGSVVSSGTSVILAVNFIASLLLDKALDAFYAALNSVQILYYMPLINIPFPKFLYTIFRYLSYATLENELLADPISQNVNFDNIKDQPLNDAFENYSIESQLFLQSFKYKGGMLFLIFGPLPFVIVLSKFKHRAFDTFRKMKKFYFFNGTLRFGYEIYLEMGIFAYLNINNLQFQNRDQLIASVIAILAIVHITFYPIISMNIIQKFSHRFEDTYFKEKLSTLIEGTKVNSVSRLAQYHFSIFMFRRLTYIVILVLLADYPLLQIVLCAFKTLLMVIYFIVIQPFESKLTNFMQIFNESLTGIAFSMCYVFTNDMTDNERIFYAWVIICIVATVLLANLMVAIVETAKGIWELIHSSIKRFKKYIQKRKSNAKSDSRSKISQKLSKDLLNQSEINQSGKDYHSDQDQYFGQTSYIRSLQNNKNVQNMQTNSNQDSNMNILTNTNISQSMFDEDDQLHNQTQEFDLRNENNVKVKNYDISIREENLRLKLKISTNYSKNKRQKQQKSQRSKIQSQSDYDEFEQDSHLQDYDKEDYKERKRKIEDQNIIQTANNFQNQINRNIDSQNIQSRNISISMDDHENTNDKFDSNQTIKLEISNIDDKNRQKILQRRQRQHKLRELQNQYQEGIRDSQLKNEENKISQNKKRKISKAKQKKTQ